LLYSALGDWSRSFSLSKIIKAQSVTLIARSKEVSATIAAAEAEMMQLSFLNACGAVSQSL
jgi:hypothetical protein